ncbi:MAG: ABC transporter ATP-binding protein [Pseudomonadota bacterium]|nr:ABC transporter ATP-binding protein [Pseudomonadota bacterium]
MTIAIRTEKLSKVYRSGFWRIPYTGLSDLDLEVPEGTSFGFIGPNGAGKTTAIKTLMSLQKATGGRAWIHGIEVPDPESRRRVGFLPERPYFYEHLTAGEFLDFYGRLCEVPSAERGRRVARLLERVDLDRFRDVPLGKFSKGMLQRAGLAQALVGEPDLLVLDEPMSGLDPLGRVLVRDLILEERRLGRTVFFSSHVLADVEAICDRVAIVVSGKLRGQGTVAELLGHTVAHVDCTFVGVAEGTDTLVPGVEGAPAPNHLVAAPGGHLTRRLDPNEVDHWIDAARRVGGTVASIVPAQRTLEQVLLDEVERARPVDAKRLGVLA